MAPAGRATALALLALWALGAAGSEAPLGHARNVTGWASSDLPWLDRFHNVTASE